jgi:hypothetical protein
MMYNTQNFLDFVHRLLFLNNLKTEHSGNWDMFPSSGEGRELTTLERANPNQGPITGASFPSPENRNRSQFPKCSVFKLFRISDYGQKVQ